MEVALIALAVTLVVVAVVIVWVVLRRDDATSKEIDQRMAQLVAAQGRSQENLSGQLKMLNDQQSATAAATAKAVQESSERLTKSMNDRLEQVQDRMGQSLTKSSKETAESVTKLMSGSR